MADDKLTALTGDFSCQFRCAYVFVFGDLMQGIPKLVLQRDTRLLAVDENRAFEDGGPHSEFPQRSICRSGSTIANGSVKRLALRQKILKKHGCLAPRGALQILAGRNLLCPLCSNSEQRQARLESPLSGRHDTAYLSVADEVEPG